MTTLKHPSDHYRDIETLAGIRSLASRVAVAVDDGEMWRDAVMVGWGSEIDHGEG